MNLLALSLFMQAQSPQPVVAARNPAIEAFQEACIEGSLKLSPSRGRVLKESEITTFMDVFDWDRGTSRRVVVKLNYVPSTYLVFADYKHLQRNSIASSCTLVSGAVSHEEAAAAFLRGLPDSDDPQPKWWPNMHIPLWTADHPQLGYRKRLRFRDDGSILLQVGTYPTANTNLKSGTTKQ
jgi:hypothetical protein